MSEQGQVRNCNHVGCVEHKYASQPRICESCVYFRSADLTDGTHETGSGYSPATATEHASLSYVSSDNHIVLSALKESADFLSEQVHILQADVTRAQVALLVAQAEYDNAVQYHNHEIKKALALCNLLTQIQPPTLDNLAWPEHFGIVEIQPEGDHEPT